MDGYYQLIVIAGPLLLLSLIASIPKDTAPPTAPELSPCTDVILRSAATY